MVAKNFNDYLQGFPPHTQKLLKQMRQIIKKATPRASEIISYGMPAFKLDVNLVYFAGYARHIGFYPGSDGIAQFKKEIAGKYKWATGSVQFPIDQKLPTALITRMVKFKVKLALERRKKKAAPKK